MKPKFKSTDRLKQLFGVFANILNNNIDRIVTSLDTALKAFPEKTITSLAPSLLQTVRNHVASLIATYYTNIPATEFAAAVNMTYFNLLHIIT